MFEVWSLMLCLKLMPLLEPVELLLRFEVLDVVHVPSKAFNQEDFLLVPVCIAKLPRVQLQELFRCPRQFLPEDLFLLILLSVLVMQLGYIYFRFRHSFAGM